MDWLGSHYGEVVGTLALVVTTTNLVITLRRLRRESRAQVASEKARSAGDEPQA